MRQGLGSFMRSNCIDLRSKSNLSYRRAMADISKFLRYTQEAGISKSSVLADPAAAVQSWIDQLITAGKSPATIHTYAASACRGLQICMDQVSTPRRTVSSKSKSIGLCQRSADERSKPENLRLVQFQQAVGIRRSELAALRGRNLKRDFSGALCVEVERGKGGKYQLQRIAPQNEAFVISYFSRVRPDELVFSPAETGNKNLDLHGIRAEHARAEYERYLSICHQPGGRAQLQHDLLGRYTSAGPDGCKAYQMAQQRGKHLSAAALLNHFVLEMQGTYHLRGDNRRIALQLGRPISYDKTALMAVSVFSLAHWRNEVTVKHYMI